MTEYGPVNITLNPLALTKVKKLIEKAQVGLHYHISAADSDVHVCVDDASLGGSASLFTFIFIKHANQCVGHAYNGRARGAHLAVHQGFSASGMALA